MAGDGVFEVQGTIYDNSNGCLTYVAPGTYPNETIANKCGAWGTSDILDGKQSGTMYDWGNLEYSTAVTTPWDSCFDSTGPTVKNPELKNASTISSITSIPTIGLPLARPPSPTTG